VSSKPIQVLKAFLEELLANYLFKRNALGGVEDDKGLSIPANAINNSLRGALVASWGGRTLVYESGYDEKNISIKIASSLDEGKVAIIKGDLWLLNALVAAYRTSHVALGELRYAAHNKHDPGKIIYTQIQAGIDKIIDNILSNS